MAGLLGRCWCFARKHQRLHSLKGAELIAKPLDDSALKVRKCNCMHNSDQCFVAYQRSQASDFLVRQLITSFREISGEQENLLRGRGKVSRDCRHLIEFFTGQPKPLQIFASLTADGFALEGFSHDQSDLSCQWIANRITESVSCLQVQHR